MTSEEQAVYARIEEWWTQTTIGHMQSVVPKMVEYGSRDLVEIGRGVLDVAGKPDASDNEAYEAGVYFYVRGKLARWATAVGRGVPVSRDTLDDIIIYCMMVLDNRDNGGN